MLTKERIKSMRAHSRTCGPNLPRAGERDFEDLCNLALLSLWTPIAEELPDADTVSDEPSWYTESERVEILPKKERWQYDENEVQIAYFVTDEDGRVTWMDASSDSELEFEVAFWRRVGQLPVVPPPAKAKP